MFSYSSTIIILSLITFVYLWSKGISSKISSIVFWRKLRYAKPVNRFGKKTKPRNLSNPISINPFSWMSRFFGIWEMYSTIYSVLQHSCYYIIKQLLVRGSRNKTSTNDQISASSSALVVDANQSTVCSSVCCELHSVKNRANCKLNCCCDKCYQDE